MNSPFSYGYDTETSSVFTHVSFPIGIDKEEATGIVNEALGTLKLDKTEDGYEMTINGTTVGNIAMPDDRFLSNIDYDSANKKLLFKIKGSDEPVEVDVTPFLNEYQGGENVTVEGNVINVKLDDYVTDEALKSLLADYAKASDLEKMYDNRETEAVDSIAELVEYTDMLKTQVDKMPDVIDEKINAAKITKVSELDNDLNFTTAEEVGITIDELTKDFITRDESNTDIQAAVEDLATKEDLEEYEGRLVDFVEKGDISELPTKDDVKQSISTAIEPLATKEGMDAAIASATEGMATETYVNEAIGNIEIPVMPDLTPYATTEAMESALENKQDKGNYIPYTVNSEGRKVVTLDNADIFGAIANLDTLQDKLDVSGWVSLIQLNKWNVVDLGSPKTITNINTPDGVRPTIQEKSQSGPEAHKMAYLDDLNEYSTKEEVKSAISDAVEDFSTKSEVEGVVTAAMANKATEAYVDEAIAKIEMPDLAPYATTENVDAALKEKQDKGNYITYVDENGRKVVTLNNADIFGAIANKEELQDKFDADGWISLIQLNKWNVVDLGSSKTMTNINTPDGVRPTIQEKSQSGPNAHKMAYLDDLDNVVKKNELDKVATKGEIAYLKALLRMVCADETVNDNTSKISDTLPLVISGGNIVNNKGMLTRYQSKESGIACENLTVDKSTLEFIAYKGDVTIHNLKSIGDISEKDVNVSRNGLSIYASDNVSIMDSELMQKCYNMVNIGMNAQTPQGSVTEYVLSLTKNVTIENVKFGDSVNNGIIIFSTDDNAVINIKDVSMNSVKNALRLSNYKDKKNIVVNIENFIVDHVVEKFMLLEDYRNRREVNGELNYPNDSTDLFDGTHMTFNFKNVIVGGVKLTKDMDKSEYLHMVVGKPSIDADKDVTEACKDNLVINFID